MSYDKHSTYGRYTYGKIRVWEWGEGAELIVGSFCSIASDVNAFLGGEHRKDWVSTWPFGTMGKETFTTVNGNGNNYSKGNIIIGNDVWIGAGATIMSGVTIGDGAVIANNAHVVKNVQPYAIVGGNPATLIRYRFSPEQIQTLLEIKWWNWDVKKINEFLPLICSTDIDAFLKAAQENSS